MNKFIVAMSLLIVSSMVASAQVLGPFGDTPTNHSVKITTGGTYQSVSAVPVDRFTITLENNNINGDACWVELTGKVVSGNTTSTSVTVDGVSITAAQASILIVPGGGSYGRYTFTPTGTFVVTCQNTGDSIYIDNQ